MKFDETTLSELSAGFIKNNPPEELFQATFEAIELMEQAFIPFLSLLCCEYMKKLMVYLGVEACSMLSTDVLAYEKAMNRMEQFTAGLMAVKKIMESDERSKKILLNVMSSGLENN